MKRNLLIICVLGVTLMTSCGGSKPSKPVFNNQIDTVSYCFGMARTNGFIEYLAGQMGIDTTYMADFVKGFMEGSKKTNDPASKAYLAGMEIARNEVDQIFNQIGSQIFGSEEENQMNLNNYINGFLDGAMSNFNIMTREEASNTADRLYEQLITEQQEIQAQKRAAEFAGNKEAGEKFLAEKAKEDGVIALESGVLYKIIKKGNGAIAKSTDKVKAKYEGRLIDGTVFDSSEKNNSPEGIEFPVMGVIKGWQEILQLMPAGSKWQVYIPQELAYGERETGNIKPFSALEFDVEVVEVIPQ